MTNILLTLIRYSSNTESTIGAMLVNGNYECDTLEDESRVNKKKKETRLRGGVWELRIRKQVTPLTQKYRDRYDWFKYHIEIISPEFTGTYIHNGTTDDHTEGCPLVGERNTINTYTAGTLKKSNSVKVFKEFYEKVYPLVEQGNQYISILDLDIPVK
jgi:hypothetical protein